MCVGQLSIDEMNGVFTAFGSSAIELNFGWVVATGPDGYAEQGRVIVTGRLTFEHPRPEARPSGRFRRMSVTAAQPGEVA